MHLLTVLNYNWAYYLEFIRAIFSRIQREYDRLFRKKHNQLLARMRIHDSVSKPMVLHKALLPQQATVILT